MSDDAKGYDFRLTRFQRFCSLVAGWWVPSIILCFLLMAFGQIALQHPFISGLLILFFFRGLLFGVLNLFFNGTIHVEIENLGVGFGQTKADWWIFTDGIKQIRRNRWGTTSILHHNGTCLDIPTELLSEEDYQKLEAGMQKYRNFLSGNMLK